MNAPDYSLSLLDESVRTRARRWLLLGVLALGIAGIFAGLLGSTKSDFFYTALTVHVDLSVLVWFLTMACMLFTICAGNRGLPMVADAAFYCFAAGTLLIVLSAFTGGTAYMSNYIPVIRHPVFFLGLSLLLCGVLGSVAHLLVANWVLLEETPQQYAITSAALIMLIAIACFVLSQLGMPADLRGQEYYEAVFWGGGHVLQFAHVQLMLVAWLWMAGTAGLTVKFGKYVLMALYSIGLLATVIAPVLYHWYEPATSGYRTIFTMLMKHSNGLAPLIVGVFLTISLIKDKWANKLSCIVLGMSILLFAVGGGLGYMIAGSNLIVPAHYHGSIVSITLAFMGVAYLLLPQLGYADVSNTRLARLQPVLYGGGQLCWMAGMAVLGAHGVARKTPGSADTMGAFASFLKHGGDGLALIGGLLFVFVVLRAVYKRDERGLDKR